jgi:hypothetical protein
MQLTLANDMEPRKNVNARPATAVYTVGEDVDGKVVPWVQSTGYPVELLMSLLRTEHRITNGRYATCKRGYCVPMSLLSEATNAPANDQSDMGHFR